MRNPKLRTSANLLIAATIALAAALTASAQQAVPMLMNYQGELKSPTTGDPVRDDNYDMVFEIFTAETRGLSVWRGSYTAANRNPVEVKDGLFSAILGSGTGNKIDASVFDGSDRWLEISVGTETLLPRQRITSAAYSFVSENSRLLGGKEPSEYVIQAQGLRLQPTATSPNIIAGHEDNAVTAGAVGATIGGGGAGDGANLVTDDYGAVGGGKGNQAGDNAGTTGDAYYATVGGGYGNTASDTIATVGGGGSNTASQRSATVGGGESNTASGYYTTVGGGNHNTASGYAAAVGAGSWNRASADYATIAGGGPYDPADALNTNNRVFDEYGTIGGGGANRAGSDDADSTTARYATVCGGQSNTASRADTTVSGGVGNTASGSRATVAGGRANTASGSYAAVGGGFLNQASGDYATISGGGPSDPAGAVNTNNRVFDNYGTIGGGGNNRAGSDDADPTTDRFATVGGGYKNAASGREATVGGGYGNTASDDYATVGGGIYNTASGTGATVAGGSSNTAAGNYSFAAGRRANAIANGSFVWADSKDFNFGTTTANSFTVRATGGFDFITAVDAEGHWTSGAQLNAGSGTWSSYCDRNAKANFVAVQPRAVLEKVAALPISTWNYVTQDPSIRHMGPMAQDLYAAFGLGSDDKHIGTIDADGVALAAIQGLHEIVQEKDAKISSLESRIEALETLVEKLVESQAGGE